MSACKNRALLSVVAAILLSAAVSARGATNLLVNGGFEDPSTPTSTYFDGSDPSVADDVLGWVMYLGAQDGSYVLVSSEPDPGAGGHDADMGVGPGRGGIKTAPGSRVAIGPSVGLTATCTSDNYFGPNATSYFIDFFDSGGTLLSSVGGPISDPNGPLVYDPYNQLFSVMGFSPAGTASAGVRFESGDASYNGLAADKFSLSLGVPEPGCLSLLAVTSIALLRRRRRAVA